jgi:hypothetical protein
MKKPPRDRADHIIATIAAQDLATVTGGQQAGGQGPCAGIFDNGAAPNRMAATGSIQGTFAGLTIGGNGGFCVANTDRGIAMWNAASKKDSTTDDLVKVLQATK